ncbi:hypothetical protein L7F22_060891 [Adiantum nelumboides]|nr:hypothetical protein [Adiantum nelumboides]
MDFASPLVQMSANAYRYPGPLRSIAGWSLSSQIAPLHPPHGGAHALVFEEQSSCKASQSTYRSHDVDVLGLYPRDSCDAFVDSQNCAGCTAHRVIVAFRGTQIAPTVDSLADLCADKLLWEGLDLGSLPAKSSVFNPYTLDYFSQALNYTLQVINLYPTSPILLSGHSLGAGLAILVAGALSHVHTLPVIGFGAPGTRKPLFERNITVESLEDGRIMVIGHEWDVIMRTQMGEQVGYLCLYPQKERSSCKACIQDSRFMFMDAKQRFSSLADGLHDLADLHGKTVGLPAGDCMDCFFETHYLKNLIMLVDHGLKPICKQARDMSFSQS